jgi:hypothetical protein
MWRPRRAGLGVLSPRRAPNLGKIRRRACLRLIPFPGTGDILLAPTMISHPLAYVAPTTRHDLKKLLAKLKEKSLNARMKHDPAFATSPICIFDNYYDFAVDPELITLVESGPFYGYESETVVAHLTKLNDIATLFTHEEKIRYYYILKLFPFSLKGDAKIWFNSLDPGCVCSPHDMIYYFSAKYFPDHKKQAALREIYNFVQNEEESLPQAWGRLLQLLNALPDHPL